jgi:CspA family cold shock protein
MNGFKSLKEGQKVQFEVVQGPKGKQASNIQQSQ